ncbi:HAMP domain-containing sensor histidine kinase [Litoribrevibacter albus]|uniref:histidine kinase n=1 Tax=Litoribrevibacter albus TaxID=1473156 RepID=A0AA37W5Z5_9GAMM|nr:ATP-binding protein [Litoribrevibacter albus]GLQ31587.1 two-component sensor histidine kinase [Litoribrevibacter albus]
MIIITAVVLRLSRPQSNELPPPLSKAVVKAEMAYQRHGEAGLINWAQRINRRIHPHRVYVLSEKSDLLNRPIPPQILDIAEKISEEQKTIGQKHGRNVYFGYYLTDYQGKGYRLIFDHPPRPGEFFRHIVDHFWLVILLVAGFTGCFSYLLARNLTRPIKAMQEATNALADGDLDIQISGQFQNRKDEIAVLACDFDRMTKQLKHAYNHQNRLIQDMSHELRAPISRMQVALALLESEQVFESQAAQQLFERIQTEINQFDQIIKQTLSLPLFEQEKHPKLETRENVQTTLKALIDDLQFETQSELNIALETIPPEGEFFVYSKDNWLSTIFRNLISNALQYRTAGSSVNIVLTKTKQQLKISVSNEISEIAEQPNLNEEQLEDIFEPFYRADQARTPGTTNLGLGLSIVKGLTIRLGGQVHAETVQQNGQRTSFIVTVELPMAVTK